MMKRIYETLHKNDECYTPAYAVRPLLPYLDKFLGKIIWCPFDTDESEYVKLLRAAGHTVINQHIASGNNFFDAGDGLFAQPLPEFDLIVSNPPFSGKAKLVERVISFGKPFALLLPMTWLNDSAPARLFGSRGGVDLELLLFDSRVRFKNCGPQPSFGVGYWCSGILPKQIIFEPLIRE